MKHGTPPKKTWRVALSTTHLIMLSFLAAILVGSLLLALPVCSADGEPVPYVDALFTATTSVCVTGLVTVTTATAWSVWGQIVILLLIQVGGLGVITVTAGVMMALKRRMGLNDRLLLQDAFNLNTMDGLSAFLKKVIVGTLIIEGIGALLHMIVFVPDFGAKGIWISIFHAVSAFCNAGIDIMGSDSLMGYVSDPLVNIVTSLLIILGGLGYIVWWDVLRSIRTCIKRRRFRLFCTLTLHSKLTLVTTAVLLLGGGLLFWIFERNNPLTIGELSLFDQFQAAFFQSVTTRTAGFASIPQQHLSGGSVFTSIVLMGIGGSPVGTAGGMKTVTIAVLFCSTFCTIRGRKEVTAFHRAIATDQRRKAVAVVGMFACIVAAAALLLAMVENASLDQLLFETVSAAATVGLTRDMTPYLSTLGKLIITATMYLGRVGPISLAIAFNVKKESPNIIQNPTESVSVG